jgi:nitronate monooxygenase
LLDERVPVFSFIYGVPPSEILEECRAKRIVTIGTATTALVPKGETTS